MTATRVTDRTLAEPHPAAFWPWVLATTAAWIGLVLWQVSTNPRLLASWHGFVHTGIALRFPSPTFTPENPFFAGEVISYYWVYQWLGHAVSQLAGIDALHAFQTIAIASLALMIVAGALAGRLLYRSTAAGLLVGYLAILGTNPFGPAIAAAKSVMSGEPLMQYARLETTDDVFVTHVAADRRMARPRLGALYVDTDWRRGQNLAWFFDVSSRGPTLALIVVLGWLLVQRGPDLLVGPALVAGGALAAALNPIIGLSAAGALTAAAAATWAVSQSRSTAARVFGRTVLILAGTLLTLPTYAHLAKFPGALDINHGRDIVINAVSAVAGFVLLAPLAWLGSTSTTPDRRPALLALTLAGLLLILPVPFVGLSEGNEHNFANAASCLLAFPAAGWIVTSRNGRLMSRPGIRAALCATAFIPMTIGTLVAFGGREPLPLSFDGPRLRHEPRGGSLDAFYQWASTSTPANAVLITDPEESVKMSGNVSEVPAFTGRALFVDQLTYMTAPYADRGLRSTLATHATSGQPLSDDERAYLRGLGRPLYVVTFRGDREALFDRLLRLFGNPAFHQASVAAFALDPGRAQSATGSTQPVLSVLRRDRQNNIRRHIAGAVASIHGPGKAPQSI